MGKDKRRQGARGKGKNPDLMSNEKFQMPNECIKLQCQREKGEIGARGDGNK